MSSAGPFTIISNDGKQDKLLMASQLLESRLSEITARKRKSGLSPDDPDSLPTLMDIEQTHILYTAAYYKPFAAIGFSYNRTNTTGTASLGNDVTFSIQQYGDFFNDMAVHLVINQPVVTGTTSTSQYAPQGRWTDYPGQRALSTVKFSVNGSDLDTYNRTQVVFQQQLFVSTDKQVSWSRCMGQEVALQGFQKRSTKGLLQSVAADVLVMNSRIPMNLCNGAQTPQFPDSTASIEMFIPLLFWFNQSVRLAVPSAAIPYGQRFVTLTLATGPELYGLVPREGTESDVAALAAVTAATVNYNNVVTTCALYVNNIFVLPEIHNIYIKRISFTLVRVHLIQRAEQTTASNDVLLSSLKWPIEYLMAGLRPKDYDSIVSTECYLYFSKWHLFNLTTLTTKEQPYKVFESMTSLSGSISEVTGIVTIAAAVGPPATPATLPCTVPVGSIVLASIATQGVVGIVTVAGALAGTTFTISPIPLIAVTTTLITVLFPQQDAVIAPVVTNTIDTFGITSHNINLYEPTYLRAFYNAYLMYNYGQETIRSPNDTGILFIPFCLFPGAYQPSGHVNVSRTREFYANYTSSYCDSTHQCILYVAASAINFLLIADGSAVMRFNT